MAESKKDDLSTALNNLKRDSRRLIKPFQDLGKVRPSDPGALDQLEALVKRMPTGETFGKASEHLRSELKNVLSTALSNRRENFRRVEAEFISEKKRTEKVTETSDGWRIGPLEIECRREEGRARALYNHDPVIGWSSIDDVEDFQDLQEKALRALEHSEIDPEKLAAAFAEAYRFLLWSQKREKRLVSIEAVPIVDFYREVRVALVRGELGGRPDKRIKRSDFKKWAFLYNLDRFVSRGGKTARWRLALQTGTQREQAKGMAMTTNGLTPTGDYKSFSYVKLELLKS